MTALLVGVTFVALGVAGALLFYVLRLSREDRERHQARAAALAERIGGAPHDPAALDDPDDQRIEPRPLFGEVTDATRARSPLLAAAGALVVVLALAGAYLFNRAGATAAANTQRTAALELMSLRHERSGEALVVTGVVHNPGAGRAYDDLVAVVFAFDSEGSYLSSGRAGLDFRRLPPGEESPFSITLPSAAGIARYRVSFRTNDAVIPHLDRRHHAAVLDRGASQ